MICLAQSMYEHSVLLTYYNYIIVIIQFVHYLFDLNKMTWVGLPASYMQLHDVVIAFLIAKC